MTQETPHERLSTIKDKLSSLSSAPLTSDQRAVVENCLGSLEAIEDEFHRVETDLQESRQARSKFVSVVTHELRTPMTSIKGYTDLLRAGVVGPINEQQQNFLNIIRSNVERMSALISDLSDINHIETGRLKLDLKPVSISECIDQALLHLKPNLEGKAQVLNCLLPPDLIQVIADPNRITQCLTTLISNANQYTPAGGQISIRAVQESSFVRIEVEDTGIGISSADQAHLFSAFFRSEAPEVRNQPGWGLALNVAKQLVGLMQGEIGVESAPNKGSAFWIKLPIYIQAA